MKWLLLALSLASLPFAAAASSTRAAVFVGQLSPSPQQGLCDNGFDRLQQTVTSGTSYVMPADGTITAWSNRANSSGFQRLKMKVFRPVAGQANTFTAVGQDGPRDLAPNAINTFSTNIAVKTGDVLGFNSIGDPSCQFSAPGDNGHFALFNGGDLANGQSGTFVASYTDSRLNIRATLDPSNALGFAGKTALNKGKGTARVTVEVPGPGLLEFSGKGVKIAQAAAAKTVTQAGPVSFLIRAKGKKQRRLRRKSKVRVSASFTFTPNGGTAGTQSVNVLLKRRDRDRTNP